MSFNCEKDVADKIETFLTEAGCCSRCVQRFTGERDSHTFYEPVTKKCEEEPAEKKRKDNVCVTCLNVLTHFSESPSLDEVVGNIQGAGFEFKDFLFSITLPTALLIRQFAMLVHLKSQFPDVYRDIQVSDLVTVKEVWKWIATDYMESKLGKEYSTTSDFHVKIYFDYEDEMVECREFWKSHDNNYEDPAAKKKKMRKNVEICSKNAIDRLLLVADEINLGDHIDIPLIPNNACTLNKIICNHAPLFLAGRYNKYSRTLSQTPWIVDTGRITESSVQELICASIADYIKADEIRFSSSGREDVDVRTLGKGRPFVLQFINPKRSCFTKEHLKKMENEVNSSTEEVAIRDFQLGMKDALDRLKEGEEEKQKTYSALCYTARPLSQTDVDKLNQMKDVVLKQKTPIRVLHRRPLAYRERIVHSMSVDLKDPYNFMMKIVTQAGTYIKEFVHGDFGRTKPNLCEILGTDTDILELDVEAIDQDWPPRVEDE